MFKDLYSYFKSIKKDLTEEDEKLIDALFHSLSKECQEGINGYISGKYHNSDAVGRKAYSDISLLRKKFERLQVPRKVKTLYDYFENIEKDLTEEDKKEIDALFYSLSIERQEGINGYVAGKYHNSDAIGRQARVDIRRLKYQFERLQVPRKVKTLYDYFENIEKNLTEEDKKEIDTLFYSLSKERQEGIKGYIEGKYHNSDAVGRKAYSDISFLRKKFERLWIPRKVKTLYDCFRSIKEDLTEEDKKEIDALFYSLSKECQEGINGYIAGKYHNFDAVGRKAYSNINLLRKQFKHLLVLQKGKTLYDCCQSIKEDLTEKDKNKIDELFHSLSIERQERIKGYIEGKYYCSDAVGRKASDNIQFLKKKFRNSEIIHTTPLKSYFKNIYSYFKSIKEDLTEEDKKLIDALFHSLSKECQEGINGYIAGKYHNFDAVGRKAYSNINLLRKQFKHLLVLQKGKTLYDCCQSIKEDLTEKDKNKIDELFHSLSIERQERIKGYIEGKYYCSDAVGRKASDNIQFLKKKFRNSEIIHTTPLKSYFKNIYSYFKSIKEDLTEEDKKLIDALFHSLSKERQERIKGYIEGKYYNSDAVGKKASSDINLLRKQFKCLQAPQKVKTLYDCFRSDQEELTVEDIRYIDSLLLELPLENQKGILEYLQNKHLKKSFIARRARFDLGIMQNKFRDRKKEILLKRLELLRVLRQVLNEEKANDEPLRLMRKK